MVTTQGPLPDVVKRPLGAPLAIRTGIVSFAALRAFLVYVRDEDYFHLLPPAAGDDAPGPATARERAQVARRGPRSTSGFLDDSEDVLLQQG